MEWARHNSKAMYYSHLWSHKLKNVWKICAMYAGVYIQLPVEDWSYYATHHLNIKISWEKSIPAYFHLWLTFSVRDAGRSKMQEARQRLQICTSWWSYHRHRKFWDLQMSHGGGAQQEEGSTQGLSIAVLHVPEGTEREAKAKILHRPSLQGRFPWLHTPFSLAELLIHLVVHVH